MAQIPRTGWDGLNLASTSVGGAESPAQISGYLGECPKYFKWIYNKRGKLRHWSKRFCQDPSFNSLPTRRRQKKAISRPRLPWEGAPSVFGAWLSVSHPRAFGCTPNSSALPPRVEHLRPILEYLSNLGWRVAPPWRGVLVV